MSSQRRIDASRANGALSCGPVTHEGHARCQTAPTTHGLTARSIVLETESQDDFRALRDAYLIEFQPESTLELYLVEQLVAAQWRLDRAAYIETALLDLEVARQEPQIRKEFEACDNETRTAIAFRTLCDESRAFASLDRYEARLQRTYTRALKTLTALRENRKVNKGPNPTNGQCDPPSPPSPGAGKELGFQPIAQAPSAPELPQEPPRSEHPLRQPGGNADRGRSTPLFRLIPHWNQLGFQAHLRIGKCGDGSAASNRSTRLPARGWGTRRPGVR
jgi:hypothetical protein